MEILFENSYTKDKDLLKEFYSYYYFKRPSEIILEILALFLIIKNIIDFAYYGYINNFTLFAAIFYLTFKIIYYNYIIRIQLRMRNELNNNKPLDIKTIVTDKKIQNTSSNGGVNEITYDKIKKGFQTKNFIFLLSKAKLVYIFKKNTFTKGTKDEFINFIKNKGIKIK